MTDSFLDNAGGYTPVPDKLVREYDFTTAYVWGKVWRYCQMQNGACTASHETIAKRAGMSRRTLIEKLNILIQDGYIEDLTPTLKNKPHTYCTKKGEAKITSTMQISHTESTMATEDHKDTASGTDVSMRTLHSDDADNAQSDPSTMQNLHSEDAGIAQPTMQNLHLKKDSLETLKETKKKEKIPPKGVGKPTKRESKNPHLSRQMFTALAKVCKIDLTVLTSKTRGELNQNECALRNGDVRPDDLTDFEAWWYAHSWRGKRGQSPEPSQVIDNWGQFKDRQKGQSQLSSPPDPIPKPPKPEHVTVWEAVKPMVRDQMTRQTFDTLFKDAEPIARENGTFELRVKASALEMIEARPRVRANVLTAIQAVKPEIHDLDFKELTL